MRHLSYSAIGILILLLIACQSGQKQEQNDIRRLEQAAGESPGPEQAGALIERYDRYAGQYPDDDEMNSKYLYRAAGLAYRMNRYSQAIELLERAIREDYAGSNTANNAHLLAAIYEEKLRNEPVARTIYQAAAAAFPDEEVLRGKVDAGWPDIDARLREMKQQVFDPGGQRIDYRVANDFITSASLSAMLLPQDDRSPEWLFIAAETARDIRAFSKALELYAWLAGRFPGHPRAPEALFLQAFTLDNDLGRYEEAGVLYRTFLERYPENEFADDAEFSLKILGKDEEEIIRAFEEQNEQ